MGDRLCAQAGVYLPESLGEYLGGLTKVKKYWLHCTALPSVVAIYASSSTSPDLIHRQGGSLFGIRRARTWQGKQYVYKTGNMLPEWTFVDRAGLVQHLTNVTQHLHPDR